MKATKKSVKRGLVSLFAGGLLIAQPTLEHPVWTENHQDYVPAQDLKVGDTFLDGKGASLRLDSLAIKPDTTLTVYNFEVNDLHNYYVGTQEVLVHNDCAALTRLEDLGISKSNLTALENSFRKSGVIKTDRTKLYNKLKGELEAGSIEKADINRLITDLDNGSFSKKAKKYITTNADLGSIRAWKVIQNWSNRQEVLDLLASLKLNNKVNNYNVIGTNGGTNLKIYDTDIANPWATIRSDKTVVGRAGAIDGGNIENLNQVLNVYPHLKKSTYIVNDVGQDGRFEFKTDPDGNVYQLTDNNISYPGTGNTRMRSPEQGYCVTSPTNSGKGAKAGDAGGHITSNEANGPSEQINYWAMNAASNSNGAWRNMEKYIRDNLKGAYPTAKFKVVYTGTDWTKGRPGKISVRVWKDDIELTIDARYSLIDNP